MSHYLIPDWEIPSNIRACVTLRFDGHSLPPFDHFNLSARVGDDSSAVAANRAQLMKELNLEQEPVWLHQVHGITAVCADAVQNETDVQADAIYTETSGLVCAVQTADCLPILLCHSEGFQIAAIHAGWRGLAAGVIEATVQQLSPPYQDWMAWLGPAISAQAYPVGNLVREAFIKADPQAEQAFQPIQPNQWRCDLYQLARQRLIRLGIERITGGNFCTYSEPHRFYSFRRDQEVTGRMASLIWKLG